jgi:hypothetical protein
MLTGILLFSLLWSAAPAQRTDTSGDVRSEYLTFEETPPLAFLFPYFPPYLLYDGDQLKGFIRSDEFKHLRSVVGDRGAMDAIYVRALRLTGGNAAIALLISSIGCFDHEIIGLRVPVLSIFFPLTGESMADFDLRVRNLPTKLYDDSPPTAGGDRDKLQHFFGSAFLSYIFESRQSANRIGDFIETGEDAIIIDGTLDERDQRANRQGQEFGLALLTNPHQLPSSFLTSTVVRQRNSENETLHCFGPQP